MITSHARQLRLIRVGKGISQRQMARMSGISQASISLFESGKKPATREYLTALERICGQRTAKPDRQRRLRWRDLPPAELARAFRERQEYRP